MKTYTIEEKRRIRTAIKFIKKWKKNIRFMKNKMKEQEGKKYYEVSGMKYHPIHIITEEEKIAKAKQILESI